MAEAEDLRDQEPQDIPSAGKDIAVPKMRQAFSKLGMELSQDELASSGVRKLLLAEIAWLEQDNFRLNSYQDEYYQADKERAILKEQAKTFVFLEILYSLGLTLSAALIGLTPSFNVAGAGGWITLGISTAMIVGSVIAKLVKK